MYSKKVEERKKHETLTTYSSTGEINVQEVQTLIKAERRHFKKGEFFQMTFELLGLIKDYKSYELKAFYALLRRLDFNNRIKNFSQAEIAEEIGSSQPRISVALKRLKEDGIIREDGRELYFSDKFINYASDKRQKKVGGAE